MQTHSLTGAQVCDGGTFYSVAYVGATDFDARDYFFSASTTLHWEFDYSSLSYVSIATLPSPYNFAIPAFSWASIAKPKNVTAKVIAMDSNTPLSAPASVPQGYQRSQLAARILYHLKRESYVDGPFSHPVYYTPV